MPGRCCASVASCVPDSSLSVVLLQTLTRRVPEAVMGFVQEVYQRGVSGLPADLSDRGLIELRGIDTGEPMPAVPKQVVTELPVCLHVEGPVQSPEPYDLLKIDPARHLPEARVEDPDPSAPAWEIR